MILVLGIDAATWNVIKPNLDRLPVFKKLCDVGKCTEIVLQEELISPSIWCGMFCGKSYEEHRHNSYIIEDLLVTRKDIKVEFIWDVLHRKGKRVKALNIPFVIPPYSYGVEYKPIGFGLPTNEREWDDEIESVTDKTKNLLNQDIDVLISVYTLLDRVQHFHWGEDIVLQWYQKLDSKIGELLFDTSFMDNKRNKLIIISDHGFCSFGESRVQTLPQHSKWGQLKGDHHENALLITYNIKYPIEKPQDIFAVLEKETWNA